MPRCFYNSEMLTASPRSGLNSMTWFGITLGELLGSGVLNAKISPPSQGRRGSGVQAPPPGLEPGTFRLTVERSAN